MYINTYVEEFVLLILYVLMEKSVNYFLHVIFPEVFTSQFHYLSELFLVVIRIMVERSGKVDFDSSSQFWMP